jgi:hypothetical protein
VADHAFAVNAGKGFLSAASSDSIRSLELQALDVTMILGIRRMIAGLLAWVGKVTLLFTLIVAGAAAATYVLTRINTGAWPEAIVLGEPLRQTLQDLGVELPSSSWVVLEQFLSFVLDQPTWMIAFLAGVSVGLLLLTWGDAWERSIRHELRHQQLMRERWPRR